MTTKILLLLTLLAYSVIVSQSFMYILSLKDVQMNLDGRGYTEMRKLVDASMRANFKYAVYAALLLSLSLVIATVKNPSGLLFITALIAFLALVLDTAIMLKGNVPINSVINTWTVDNFPANWAEYRTKWLTILGYRQIANITGFVSLLVGAVFGTK